MARTAAACVRGEAIEPALAERGVTFDTLSPRRLRA
jgi:hypothetical protein